MTVAVLPPFRFPRRQRLWLARALVLWAGLLYCWMALANVVSTSHDASRSFMPGQHSASSPDAHPHDHDESDALGHGSHEGGPHQHGHNPTDHNHDKQNVADHAPRLHSAADRSWPLPPAVAVPPPPSYTFERPPREFPIL